ncbi:MULTISPECIES: hypothetical protein [Burkholderia]|uniref:Uncharacterized protein n=1 Tax=Burkholderia cenocepacia TaxID=95486 RepID=A0ABD4UE53_9BURK|nr:MULTISPECIES: hypothetical protein [Burkholderia]MBH9724953.1 hypothetical protein [Burkholderia contaminans]MBR8092838.1 hypothetical protein [Burkholderia cenocepacia]MBS6358932.1 hypothetical protein [Burkholderia sp.]MBY4710788.1 hypothetical protein [Burkholderia cepacia]MBY4737030.1 hypothetical protein [Burkholderia cepacia]
MQPEHLWNMLVGTTIMDSATSGYATRVGRRPMPPRLKELLQLRDLPPDVWTDSDRTLVESVRGLAKVLMNGSLLQEDVASMGIGLGVSKELMVCLAAFAEPGEVAGEGGVGTARPAQNTLDVMLSNIRVL